MQNETRRAGKAVKAEEGHEGKEPDEVAAAVERALSEPNPKRRYMVVPERQQAEITIETQIQRFAMGCRISGSCGRLDLKNEPALRDHTAC